MQNPTDYTVHPPQAPSRYLNGTAKSHLMIGQLTSVERSVVLYNPAAQLDSVAVMEGTARQERDSPWATFALVAVGTFMTMLDASIVNISLPSIARTFQTSAEGGIEW